MINVDAVCRTAPLNLKEAPPPDNETWMFIMLIYIWFKFDMYFQVFFKDPYHTQIVRDKTITMNQFIGGAGGILGLCMGASMVTLAYS